MKFTRKKDVTFYNLRCKKLRSMKMVEWASSLSFCCQTSDFDAIKFQHVRILSHARNKNHTMNSALQKSKQMKYSSLILDSRCSSILCSSLLKVKTQERTVIQSKCFFFNFSPLKIDTSTQLSVTFITNLFILVYERKPYGLESFLSMKMKCVQTRNKQQEIELKPTCRKLMTKSIVLV